MSFPRYPGYKDSGVEWLGEVPAHWDVGQSRRLFALRNEPAAASDKQLTASQVHGVIYQDDFVRLEGRRVVEVIKGADILKHVEPDDFVISMRSFQGGIEWCRNRGCISSAYVMIVPCGRVISRYFAYLFKSKLYIQALQATTNLVRDGQALRYDNFTQVPLPLVPLEEQSAIASFLDRETAKIDELVAEQQRLIELLKEKREAVISHAVTKGLNPDAPMKPSGVEWLGEVPAHWKVGPVKRFFSSLDGQRVPLSTEERANRKGGIPYYGASGVIDHVDEYIFEEDLVLVSEDGANLLSRSTPIAFVATGKYWVNNHAHVFRPIDQNFIFWAMRLEAIDLSPVVTGAAQPKLTSEALGNLIIAVPPTAHERRAIQDHIVAASVHIDALSSEAQRAIELLQERRTALISAAVTGQIDVRASAGKAAA
ncbi:restriction endonuclease subunit S [Corallococcus exiguus]|uniref:restriction endonuclease subunit S n=1 Tax=Corallococcus exiguus TaxID=83462 RepID=UPI001470D2BA|nr:restriction endonuclease subunit S [Corallococcus exiguus]NNC15011.1 restriction endonuclease subunit S [Corallococcus exiguus]NPC70482.1 restriction endonuclease subunit S [Corallococcus exiguus]